MSAINESTFQFAPPGKNPSHDALPETDKKIYLLVVLGRILIGLGIAISLPSLYLATLIHPLVAMSIPSIPVGTGLFLLFHLALYKIPIHLEGQPLGLINEGNNCFANVFFQLLNHASSYKSLMEELENKDISSIPTLSPLISVFRQYQAEQNSETKSSVSTVNSEMIREWYNNTNQDMQKRKNAGETLKNTQEEPLDLFWELHKQAKIYLPILEQIQDKIPKTTGDCFIPLLSDPEKANSFEELFNHFFHSFDKNNRYKKWFTHAPMGFLIHMHRGGWGSETEKIEIKVDFPIHLELTEEQCKEGFRYYSPDAFCLHHGVSVQNGHYIAYIRKENSWWKISDEWVTKVDENEIREAIQNASIVHYAQSPQIVSAAD